MNKKEVSEIRRQYVPERCTISRICGCYVDAEKNIKTTLKEAFLSLPEDDAFKYFTIFKKTLSGFSPGRGKRRGLPGVSSEAAGQQIKG